MATARNVIAGIVLVLSASGFAQSPAPAPAAGSATAKDAQAGESSAKKTFNESRPNNTRGAGNATTGVAPADAAARKTFNESRPNSTRATGGAKAGTGQAAAAVPGGSVLPNAAPPAGTAASSAPK